MIVPGAVVGVDVLDEQLRIARLGTRHLRER